MSGEMFADLLAPNLAAIRNLVRAKIRVPGDIEDVVQQTLMHAFAHRDQLRAESKFKSWISSIAMNEIRGLARRTRIYFPLDEVSPMVSRDSSSCPHQLYEQRERAERLYAGLAELNDRDRKTICLVDLAEVSVKDAANALSVGRAALKAAHFRARQRLRRAIRPGRKAARGTC